MLLFRVIKERETAHEVRWTSALRRPERSEEFDSLLWGRWIHGELDVKAEESHKKVQNTKFTCHTILNSVK